MKPFTRPMISLMATSSTPANPSGRVGYIVKRYPRFSETFIVNEILAHEAAGLPLEIFSLHPPNDTHFQDVLARVRSRVTYVPCEGLRAADLWSCLDQAADDLPGLWAALEAGRGAAGREVFQAAWIAREAHRSGITHLHAHFATTATTVARLAARFAGISHTFTAHAKDIFHEDVDPADLRRKLADAGAVVTVSDYNVAHLHREFGAAAARVCRVYNGIHLDRFPYSDPAGRPAAVVSVGRLVEKKGLAVLIDAIHRLRRDGLEVPCEIIGTGELEGALRAKVGQLGLADLVRFTGALPQGEVIRRVGAAAAMAAPCVVGSDGNADGLPTVLLEAMALGTPCVGTDVTGIPEVIRHEVTGLMVGQHDATGLASALRRLLEQPELRRRLAFRARRLLEAEFDIQRNTAVLRDLFTEAQRTRASVEGALGACLPARETSAWAIA